MVGKICQEVDTGGSRILVRGGNQWVKARKALPQGVAAGLAAPLPGSRGRALGGVWGEAAQNYEKLPNFILIFL